MFRFSTQPQSRGARDEDNTEQEDILLDIAPSVECNPWGRRTVEHLIGQNNVRNKSSYDLILPTSIPSEDPYAEAARQLLEQAPRSPKYVPDPMELEDHVPVYIPDPEHPEDLVPAEDEGGTKRPGCEVGESSAAAAVRQPGPTMARRVDCSSVDTVDVHSRESSEFYSGHHDAQKDYAVVRAEIEVLRREETCLRAREYGTRQAWLERRWMIERSGYHASSGFGGLEHAMTP
ncbi:hypothetical protein Tco_0154316 [Tanacetum coccineum]